jgi:hypothetical protein
MGNLQAAEMAAAVDAGFIELSQAVSWHLTANHFPPIGEYTDLLVDVLTGLRSGEYDMGSEISLGFDTYRVLPSRAHCDDEGEWTISVADLIDATHSYHFIEIED